MPRATPLIAVLQRVADAVGAESIAGIARALKIDDQTVRSWNDRGVVPDYRLREIALRYAVRVRWLETGELPRYQWQAEDPALAAAAQAELARHKAAARAGLPDIPVVLREPEPPLYGRAPAANDAPSLVPLSPREYALIANYRASPESEKVLMDKTSAALAQRAPQVKAHPPPRRAARGRKK